MLFPSDKCQTVEESGEEGKVATIFYEVWCNHKSSSFTSLKNSKIESFELLIHEKSLLKMNILFEVIKRDQSFATLKYPLWSIVFKPIIKQKTQKEPLALPAYLSKGICIEKSA